MKTYLVGGAVRDMILNITPHDKDYVVFGATEKEMLAAGFISVGKKFPVFLHPITKNEYALARKEEKIGDKHTDFRFLFTPDITPQEDVIRRDFTCNALLYDETQKKIIDLIGGIDDIHKKILRHINSEHFIEDPLRILRMCRFAAKLNFTIAPETMILAQQMVNNGMLDHLTPERIWNEINNALQQPNFARFILLLKECRALNFLLPEIDKLWDIPERTDYHPEGNSGAHTILSLEHAENLSAKAKFALLMHDIGKTMTPPEILPSHHGHDKAAAPLIKKICKRLKIPNSYRNLALMAAAQHMQIRNVLDMKKGRLLTLLTDICELKHRQNLIDYIKICRCDMLGRQRKIPQLELSYFRRAALRLILNFKIQSKIKATDMPNFTTYSKDATFAEKFFNYRVEKIF
ncbi:MAG: HD domain-containing protein [Alphaproteobacteria bacterium]|nr:HD domain-containing protein [Alphaproteobacteria bacterium]